MKTFRVYSHPEFDYEAVKIGISYPAFLLGWVWLIANGLRGLSLLFLLLPPPLALFAVYDMIPDQNFILVILILSLIPAFKGNGWLVNKYEKEGYKLVKSIQANNKKVAIALTENDNL